MARTQQDDEVGAMVSGDREGRAVGVQAAPATEQKKAGMIGEDS